MPSRRPLLSGTSISPRTSSNAVNEVVNVLSRKLNTSNTATASANNPTRRGSFSMDNILHPTRKDKSASESKEKDHGKDKRMSFMGGSKKAHKSKDGSSAVSPRVGPAKPATLDLIVESPPLVFYGNGNSSSGALFSGRMKLDVEDPTGQVQLTDFTMSLRATISTKKPISKECGLCAKRDDVLKTWKFLSEPKTFKKGGDNQFPFSYLFSGNLPATTHAQLGSLTYVLHATATASTGEIIDFTHPLNVQRAVPPGPDKTSIRIFPPTNLTGRLTMPPVVHPIGTFPISMTLSGVVDKRSESQTRWRLRKMMWRVEEHCKVISTPCPKHAHKVSDGKAIQHSDSKVLGNDEMKGGWKTDFDTIGGEIMIEFEASVATKSSHHAVCDMDSSAGLEVKHNLVIELIVAEEFCPNKNTLLITPTGAARVLRMQFALPVTERAGMGISWDEEQPPMYEDVPPSPPGYANEKKIDAHFGTAIMEDYNGPELEPVDLERIETTNPSDPPLYRERSLLEISALLPTRSFIRPSSSRPAVSVSDTRNRMARFQLDDLEAESEADAWRRQRQEEEPVATPEEDFGEGLSGNAPTDRA